MLKYEWENGEILYSSKPTASRRLLGLPRGGGRREAAALGPPGSQDSIDRFIVLATWLQRMVYRLL